MICTCIRLALHLLPAVTSCHPPSRKCTDIILDLVHSKSTQVKAKEAYQLIMGKQHVQLTATFLSACLEEPGREVETEGQARANDGHEGVPDQGPVLEEVTSKPNTEAITETGTSSVIITMAGPSRIDGQCANATCIHSKPFNVSVAHDLLAHGWTTLARMLVVARTWAIDKALVGMELAKARERLWRANNGGLMDAKRGMGKEERQASIKDNTEVPHTCGAGAIFHLRAFVNEVYTQVRAWRGVTCRGLHIG